jgi:hypothetical protein
MEKNGHIEVANLTRGTLLGSEIRVADTAWARMVGLLGDSELRPGCGLLIAPSSGVHTFGMRFPIDVVALDRHLCVRGVWENLGVFRIAAVGLKTHKVLELPVGAIRDSQTQVGDQLVFHDPDLTVDQKPGAGAKPPVPHEVISINPAERPTKGERV